MKIILNVRNEPKPREKLGLGDAVALVAQPIAKAIDATTRVLLGRDFATDLANCGGCKKRADKLNNIGIIK